MWLLSYQYAYGKYRILDTKNKLEDILDRFIEDYQNDFLYDDYTAFNIWYIKNDDNDFNDLTRRRNNVLYFDRSLVYVNKSENKSYFLHLPKKEYMKKAQCEKKTVFAVEEINTLREKIVLLEYCDYFYQWDKLHKMNKNNIKLLYEEAEIKPVPKWYTLKSTLIGRLLDKRKKFMTSNIEKLKKMSDEKFNEYCKNKLNLDIGNENNYETPTS